MIYNIVSHNSIGRKMYDLKNFVYISVLVLASIKFKAFSLL